MKQLRITIAAFFLVAISLLFLAPSAFVQEWLGWTVKLQFLPSVIALNIAVIAGTLVLTLLFGRFYCSVICPLGIFQDLVSRLRITLLKKKNPFSYRKEAKWLRYTVWVLFVVLYLLGVQVVVALLDPYGAYGRIMSTAIRPAGLAAIIIAAVTLLLVGILAWTGGRSYCNAICPVGTTLSFFSRFALFRPVIDADKCRNCKLCEHNCKAQCIDIANHKIDYSRCVDCFNCLGECKFDALHYKFSHGKQSGISASEDISAHGSNTPKIENFRGPRNSFASRGPALLGGASKRSSVETDIPDSNRRAFLTGAALGLGAVTLGAQEKKVDGGFAEILDKKVPSHDTPITPPGSKSVKDFYSRCTACQLCVAECPNKVLRPSMELERLMQPEMAYDKGYCRPECTRCSQLCPTGAITSISREEKTQYHIGTARIDRSLCVAQQGTKCGNCERHCPVGAIKMVEDRQSGFSIPTVSEEICIGCGACENLCPARPFSAITVNGRHNHLNEN